MSQKLVPVLNSDGQQQNDISTIGTDDYPVQPQRTLAVHMLALCNWLKTDILPEKKHYWIEVVVAYSYHIPEVESNTVTILPVILLEPLPVNLDDEWASLAHKLSTALNNWKMINKPPETDATYTFDFTINQDEETLLPILQIQLVLPLTAITAS